MTSSRLPAIAVLLALACVPTIVHTYVGMTAVDGRDVSAIASQLCGLEGRPSGRREGYVRDAYGTTEFIERHYGHSFTLFVARSYDAKALYHHPELGVAHGDSYDRAVVVRRPDRPAVPLFRLNGTEGKVSVYALLYDNRFIDQPIRFQLQHAFALLVRPKSPLTLFFVRQKSVASTPTSEELLLAAIDSFAAQRVRHEP